MNKSSGQSKIPDHPGNASVAAPQDITARSSTMPRDSALLYPNRKPKSAESPQFWGVIKLQSGATYWAALWRRSVGGKDVFELRLAPKKGGDDA